VKTLMTQQSLSTKQQSGRRSSSRAARRTQRLGESAQNSHLKVAYITRKIPPYDLLDEESLVNIEQASDTILAEIGIEFRDDAMMRRPWVYSGKPEGWSPVLAIQPRILNLNPG